MGKSLPSLPSGDVADSEILNLRYSDDEAIAGASVLNASDMANFASSLAIKFMISRCSSTLSLMESLVANMSKSCNAGGPRQPLVSDDTIWRTEAELWLSLCWIADGSLLKGAHRLRRCWLHYADFSMRHPDHPSTQFVVPAFKFFVSLSFQATHCPLTS